MNVYTWASSTLNASSEETLISTAGKLFHVRIAEGKCEFWWLCILENGIWRALKCRHKGDMEGWVLVFFCVFYATFNNISVISRRFTG